MFFDDLKKETVNCYSCSKDTGLEGGAKILKSEECPYCYASIHCCRMCRFYDDKVYNNCKESQAERILEKEKANYCEYFVLVGGKSEQEKQDEFLSNANSLFKD